MELNCLFEDMAYYAINSNIFVADLQDDDYHLTGSQEETTACKCDFNW